MADEDTKFLGSQGSLVLGTLIGAGLALLLAPKTGQETRQILREKGTDLGRRARERAAESRRAQETLADAQTKAQEWLGHGREALDDKLAWLWAAAEAARTAVREEMSKRRTKDQPLEEESTMADDRHDDLNFLAALGLIALGAMIGAGVALLLAPKSGEETRELLREKGTDLARRAQETADEAQSKATDYLGRGKEVMEEKASQLRAAFEAGRGAMREEISKLRGRDEPVEGV